jgi:hypothetical protein
LAPNIAANKPKSELPGLYGAINRGDTQNTLKKAVYKIKANAEEVEEANDLKPRVAITSGQRMSLGKGLHDPFQIALCHVL